MLKYLIVLSLLFAGLTTTYGQQQQPTQTCAGTKADGTPCKLKVKDGKTYCHHHDPNTPRCGAPKASGEPCRMPVKNQGDKCHHHKA